MTACKNKDLKFFNGLYEDHFFNLHIHAILYVLYSILIVRNNYKEKKRRLKKGCCRSRLYYGSHRLWIKRKQAWGQKFLLLLPQAVVLPGSDAVTAMVLSQYQVSPRTIKARTPCHAQCRLWDTLLRRGLRFVQWRRTRNPIKERDPVVYGRVNCKRPICWRLTLIKALQSKPISIGLLLLMGMKAQSGYIHTVFCVPSIICTLGNTRLTRSIQLSSTPELGQLYRMFWPGNPSLQVTQQRDA